MIKLSNATLSALPPGITLAFAPYADDVQRWVGEARKRGHEVLLEVPMEPYDFPDSDPGPHTLRTGTGEPAIPEELSRLYRANMRGVSGSERRGSPERRFGSPIPKNHRDLGAAETTSASDRYR